MADQYDFLGGAAASPPNASPAPATEQSSDPYAFLGGGSSASELGTRAAAPSLASRQIKQDEGLKLTPYKDTRGNWTAGYGHKGADVVPGQKITQAQADAWHQQDLATAEQGARNAVPNFDQLSPERQAVAINMAYQMGGQGAKGFEKTITAVGKGDYDTAANEMLKSDWAKQTPKRAQRLAEQMRSGQTPENAAAIAAASPLGNIAENLAAGAGRGMTEIGRGAEQLTRGPRHWISEKFGASPEANKAADLQNDAAYAEARRLDEALMGTKAGTVGSFIGKTAPLLLVPGVGGATYAGAAATGAIGGAASGALEPVVGPEESRLGNVLAGTAGGAVLGPVAKLGIDKVLTPIARLAGGALSKIPGMSKLGDIASGVKSAVGGSEPLPVAERVDPTIAKPRYKLTPGGPVPIETPPAVATTAQAVGAKVEPTLERAANEAPKPTLSLQRAIDEAQAQKLPVNARPLAAHIEADTLPIPAKLTQGQATRDPNLFSDELNGRAGKNPPVTPQQLQQQQQNLVDNAHEIRRLAAPGIPADGVEAAGQRLVDHYKIMDAAESAKVTDAYKALSDANGGHLPVNGSDAVAAADAALGKRSHFLPPEIGAYMNHFRDGGPMDMNDFEVFRTILAAAGRKADRAGDGNAAHAISTVRDAFESLPMQGEAAQQFKALADNARGLAKARFSKIKADPAYAAVVKDGDVPAGSASSLAKTFVAQKVISASKADAQRMAENLKNIPEARQAMSAAVVDHLIDRSVDDKGGRLSQAAWNRGLDTLKSKLDAVADPKTAAYVKQLGSVAYNQQVAPAGAYVNSSNTGVMQKAEEAAKKGIEIAANAAGAKIGLPVAGTVIRNVAASKAEKAAAEQAAANAWAPGAGAFGTNAPSAGRTSLSTLANKYRGAQAAVAINEARRRQ